MKTVTKEGKRFNENNSNKVTVEDIEYDTMPGGAGGLLALNFLFDKNEYFMSG